MSAPQPNSDILISRKIRLMFDTIYFGFAVSMGMQIFENVG